MNLVLKKRPVIVYQYSIFTLLTPLFVHIIYSFSEGQSAFDVQFFLQNSPRFFTVFIASLLLTYSIFNFQRASRPLSYLYYVVCFFSISSSYIYEFNKWSFLLLIIYSCLFFSMLDHWLEELMNPVINPLYSEEDIEFRPSYLIPIKIKFKINKNETHTIDGILTNWDDSYGFIRFQEQIPFNCKKVSFHCEYGQLEFFGSGVIYTRCKNGQGVGVHFIDTKKIKRPSNQGKSKWNNLVGLLTSHGIDPQLINY